MRDGIDNSPYIEPDFPMTSHTTFTDCAEIFEKAAAYHDGLAKAAKTTLERFCEETVRDELLARATEYRNRLEGVH